jgi:hypothetical protein
MHIWPEGLGFSLSVECTKTKYPLLEIEPKII